MFTGFLGNLYGIYLDLIPILWIISITIGVSLYLSKRKDLATQILLVPVVLTIVGIVSLTLRVVTG